LIEAQASSSVPSTVKWSWETWRLSRACSTTGAKSWSATSCCGSR
jgi:hypothetical protein